MQEPDWVFTRRQAVVAVGLTPVALACADSANAKPAGSQMSVASPNGKLVASLLPGDPAAPFPRWSAQLEGQPIVEPSRLALVLGEGGLLGPKAKLLSYQIVETRERWSPPYGIASSYDASSNRLEAMFEDRRRGIRFAVHLLAHDDGVAVRYALLSAKGNKVTLGGEATHIHFPAGTTVWSSRDEGEYATSAGDRLDPVPHPELTRSTDRGPLADTPLLATTPQGMALLVCESDRLHYPRLMLAPGPEKDSVVSHLMHFPGRATGYSGPGDTHAAPVFSVEIPFTTPWRLVIAATRQCALTEKAVLVPSLAAPNRLGDVGWIRPGRAFRIRKPYTNERALMCIDFAARRRLDYVEFDAHWYGDGTDPSDATVPIAQLDMPAIIAAAKAKGLGMILYVDRVPAMRQLDAIVTTYRQWGVSGIKFGFVWEGRQEDVDFIYDMVRKCGENHLLVNLHDNLRPAGLERTLPNYIALEGVRGNEQFPTARHNVTLPFTRALAGPIDYTICYDHYRNRTTNAHQLAMAVVYYNPLTFLYWYDEPAKYAAGAWPELRWFDECPTTWDESRGLSGSVGEHIVVARRKGNRWFLGAMTNEEACNVSVLLDFLGRGAWRATIYADGHRPDEPRKTGVDILSRTVRAADSLTIDLAPSGGQAVMFEPLA